MINTDNSKIIEVKLTWHELMTAAQIGLRRQIEAMAKGLPDKHGLDAEKGWGVHIEGAAGELAFAKATNRYWGGSVNTFKVGGDVGDIQVRTRSRDDYELLVRDDDRDEDCFVLVIGRAPKFKIMGYLTGKDAKQSKWRQTHGGREPAFFVPQSELRSVTELSG